jgi:NAD-dependent SIR2 family protein deacetylase
MDINTFVDTPELFYSFAKKIWPDGSILPSLTHRFFKLLVDKRKLLRIYTQVGAGSRLFTSRARCIHVRGCVLVL